MNLYESLCNEMVFVNMHKLQWDIIWYKYSQFWKCDEGGENEKMWQMIETDVVITTFTKIQLTNSLHSRYSST